MIIRRNKKNKNSKNRKRESFALIFKRVFFLLLLACFCAVALWTVFFSRVMEINSISINPETKVLKADEIRNVFFRELEGKYLGFLPKNNLLILRSNFLERKAREEFKLARTVSVERVFPDELVVSVEEREAHIVWCSNGECFFVDETAEAFLEFSGQMESVKVVDMSGKQVKLGDRVADPEFIFFLEKLPKAMEQEIHIAVVNEFETPSSMSSEVRVLTDEGWKIFFSTVRKMEIQIEILKKIIQETIGKEKTKDLEYIDLRIKGRALYKFRQSENSQEESVSEKKD